MKKYMLSLLVLGSMILGGCGDDQNTEKTQLGGVIFGLDKIVDSRTLRLTLSAADGTETLEFGLDDAEINFTFEDRLALEEEYVVTITQEPTDLNCTISNGFGTIAEPMDGQLDITVQCE